MRWDCAKAHTFLQAQPGGSSKGKINTADVIRNSSWAICSSQHLSCHSVPLKWYYLHVSISWLEWSCSSIIQCCASCEKFVIGRSTKEILRNSYMCTKILCCCFSSVLRCICFSSSRKWLCEFSSFAKSTWNYWWWQWLRQSHAYKVSTSAWRR